MPEEQNWPITHGVSAPPERASVNISSGTNSPRKLHFRTRTSDEYVINQVFQNRDYELSRLRRSAEFKAFLDRQRSTGKTPLIVDAGANIGASTVFFASMVPDAKVVAIEPDPENSKLLALNIAGLRIEQIHAALASARGYARVVDPGEGHWGYRTEDLRPAQTSDSVPCVTMNDIYAENSQQCFPFIAKIDIEGGEAELFSANTEWVRQTPLMIVELHDWMLTRSASSRTFLQCVSQLDRDFVYIGENVFSIANDFSCLP